MTLICVEKGRASGGSSPDFLPAVLWIRRSCSTSIHRALLRSLPMLPILLQASRSNSKCRRCLLSPAVLQALFVRALEGAQAFLLPVYLRTRLLLAARMPAIILPISSSVFASFIFWFTWLWSFLIFATSSACL